ncbi:hypothetical protein ACLKA6_015935 [Drosophila palustris]
MSTSTITTTTEAATPPPTASVGRTADCRKFSPNIFNKSKCSHCFRQREEHSAAALECNRASRKVSKCGYLFVAPDWDFSNPLYRTKFNGLGPCKTEVFATASKENPDPSNAVDDNHNHLGHCPQMLLIDKLRVPGPVPVPFHSIPVLAWPGLLCSGSVIDPCLPY